MSNFKGWANQNYNQFNNYQQFQEQQHQQQHQYQYQYDNYQLEQKGYYDYQQQQQPLQQQQPHQYHQHPQQHQQYQQQQQHQQQHPQQQHQQQQPPYYQQYNYPQNQFYPQNYQQQQQQQQPPQHMMYNNYQNPSNSNNYYNNNAPGNHQLYQTPTPPMEQKVEMNPPSKAMTGYKRAAYKPYTPANYIKPQQPTGTSYSLAYPTYSSMPSYNPVIANQSMKPTQIETHNNNNNNNQHESQSNTGTFNNDNQNNKTFLTLNLNPKATPYQRRGIPLNEQTRQVEPTPPIQQQQQTQNIPQQKETTYNQQLQQQQQQIKSQTKSKLIDIIHPPTLPKEQKLPEQPKPERKTELPLPTTTTNNNNVTHNPIPTPTPKPKQPKQEETKIIRKYFSITESDSQNDQYYKWPINYLKSFQNWDLSNERTLLNDKANSHLDRMKIHYDEGPNTNTSSSKATSYNKKFNIIKGSSNNNNNNDISKLDKRSKQQQQDDTYTTKAETSDMGKWGRKDFSEEVKKAEIFKKKLDEIKEQDPIKFDLTEYLNMLTVDNYNDTKLLIFNKIKDDIEHQKKFLEVLFQKAVHEKAFVNLYAKLCKDLDKDLPQKMGKNNSHGKKTTSSEMRSKLIDKCREIFKIDNNEQLEMYIKVKDPDERENKIKKFILGNVNFIGELISIKLLSKNIVFQCIDKLFSRYDNNEESGLRLISLEGIVILTDKFGTLINKQKESIEDIELKEYIKNISAILKRLSTIQKNDDIPGYVKYKIINLLEKKKNGWEETQFEKNIHAKGKDEVRKAYEESQRKAGVMKSNKDINTNQLEQEEIDNRIRDDLTEFKDFIEEGNDLNKYQWEIITEIYNERQNSIAEIMKSFIETCIDFVQNDNTLKYSSQYWEELIRYYGPNLNKNEKKEIIDDCVEMLETVNSISLDNPLLLDVWANILFTLNKHEVMLYKDLNKIKELGDSDLKSVFEIMKKIKEVDANAVKVFDKVKIVLDYKEVYDDVMMNES